MELRSIITSYSYCFNYEPILSLTLFIIMSRRLEQVNIGEEVVVRKVIASDLASKLTEMGIYDGKRIKVLFKAPLGDPIAIQVGDYTLSLRKNEAALIEVARLAEE